MARFKSAEERARYVDPTHFRSRDSSSPHPDAGAVQSPLDALPAPEFTRAQLERIDAGNPFGPGAIAADAGPSSYSEASVRNWRARLAAESPEQHAVDAALAGQRRGTPLSRSPTPAPAQETPVGALGRSNRELRKAGAPAWYINNTPAPEPKSWARARRRGRRGRKAQ